METAVELEAVWKILVHVPAGLRSAGTVVVWACLINLRLGGRDLAWINMDLTRHRLGGWSSRFLNARV